MDKFKFKLAIKKLFRLNNLPKKPWNESKTNVFQRRKNLLYL